MKILKTILAALISLSLVACSSTLQHTGLAPIAHKASGNVAIVAKAKGINERAGWGSLTVFAIPVHRVRLLGEPDSDMMIQLKDGLEHAGYTVSVISDSNKASDMPTLTCQVNKVKFWNYTWLFPLVWNWGRFDVTLTLTSPTGETIWEKNYIAKAMGWYDFEPTIRLALTRLIDMMVQDLTKNPPVITTLSQAKSVEEGQ